MSVRGDAKWSEWRTEGDPFCIGIEEEVMLLDRSWALDQGFPALRENLGQELRGRLTTETHGSAIEYASTPAQNAAEAIAELAEIRAGLVEDLERQGRAAASAGTHPFTTWDLTQVSGDAHHMEVYETMRELARREPTFAMHVHVSIDSPDLAVATHNRMRAHLPLLLALSANSPYWQGRDSGLASARTPIFQTFPRSGIPRAYRDYADFVDTLDTLIEAGAFPDPSYVWWDIRIKPDLGTIEIRIADAQSELWRVEALAALTQSLVRLEALHEQAPKALVEAPELLDENRFRAFRDGVRAELLDPTGRRTLPVSDLAELAVAACRPHARDLGCEAGLDLVERLVAEPSDQLQRELAGPDLDLPAVVAGLSQRFTAGSDPL
jgi:carboxylate-amine ligase